MGVFERAAQKLQEVREIGPVRWVSSQAMNGVNSAKNTAKNLFTKETETGERRLRRGVAAATALGVLAAGTYMITKGVSAPDSELQAHSEPLPDMWGGADALDLPTIDPPPAEPVMPDVPATVNLEPDSNPWEAVGSFAESLGYDTPNLQERDAMKDVVGGRLNGRDPTHLPIGFKLPMPNIEEIDQIYATY